MKEVGPDGRVGALAAAQVSKTTRQEAEMAGFAVRGVLCLLLVLTSATRAQSICNTKVFWGEVRLRSYQSNSRIGNYRNILREADIFR